VTAGVLLLTVAALLGSVGMVLIVAALRGVGVSAPQQRTRARVRVTRLQLVGGGAGVLTLLATGWPVAALAVGFGVMFIPSVLGGAAESRRLIIRSESLADWTRLLADLIRSGSTGSTREALLRSLDSAPPQIRGEVQNLVTRMGRQGTEPALRQWAHDIDDPAADKIAMVLILRERNGGGGLAQALSNLALSLDARTRMIREVEAERAKPRANARTIVIVTLLMVAGMTLFARQFLSFYSSAAGEVALALVVTVFWVSLRWLRRLSSPVPAPRVLLDLPAAAEQSVAQGQPVPA
jgi:tight adherence protein B